MADIPTHQYNLRSGRQGEVHLPVQIQMTEDSLFIKNLIATQGTSNSGQVSDNLSINECDCELLIVNFDDGQESKIPSTADKNHLLVRIQQVRM